MTTNSLLTFPSHALLSRTGPETYRKGEYDNPEARGRIAASSNCDASGNADVFRSGACVDLERAVDDYYAALYKFGYSLSGDGSDAADLTQETYRILFSKGQEIRDPAKVKGWLFTTLYRLFLRRRRRAVRFPQVPIDVETADWNLPSLEPAQGEGVDGVAVVDALQRIEEKFRTPLVMFYLQELSYHEMATALGVPIGTIMSRLYRGKELLRKELGVSI